MSGGIGSLLGLEPGLPDPAWNAAALRWSLTLGALLWAWLVVRARPTVSGVAGVVWCACAIGFWTSCLQRPYGLFEDPETVHRTAEISVAAASGDATEGVLSGTPASHAAWTAWLGRGVSPDSLILMPSVVPSLVASGVAMILLAFVRPSKRALVAVVLWLLLATGDLDVVRGLGLVTESWRHPGPALGLVLGASVVLLFGRLPTPPWLRAIVGVALSLAVAGLAGPGARLSFTEALLAVSLDQGVLLPIGLVGLVRSGEAAVSRGLALGGALGVLGAALAPGVVDAWSAHAFYRLGLILAAVDPLGEVLERAGQAVLSRWKAAQEAGLDARRLGIAGLVLALAPASFVTWWDPSRLDPAFESSREPFPRALAEAMTWIRQQTPPDVVFLASENYATTVATLGGRRLLRAPGFSDSDDPRRVDAESRLLQQRNLRDWVFRYGARYVFVAHGDFAAFGVHRPEDLGSRPGFRLAYANRGGYRVYEIVR